LRILANSLALIRIFLIVLIEPDKSYEPHNHRDCREIRGKLNL
jgi:hypothetical protein